MLLLGLGFHIKLFALIGACLLVFHEQRGRSILAGALFLPGLAALPLLVTPWDTLAWQYQNWFDLLSHDSVNESNFSIMTLVERTTGLHADTACYLFPGLLLLLLPLLRFSQHQTESFRFMFLASLLIWVVIFNHKAESPTYVIAMTGIAIWWVSGNKSPLRNTLLVLSFLFVAVSPTDLFPRSVRQNYLKPYSLKALFPVIIWVAVSLELLLRRTFSPECPSRAVPRGRDG